VTCRPSDTEEGNRRLREPLPVKSIVTSLAEHGMPPERHSASLPYQKWAARWNRRKWKMLSKIMTRCRSALIRLSTESTKCEAVAEDGRRKRRCLLVSRIAEDHLKSRKWPCLYACLNNLNARHSTDSPESPNMAALAACVSHRLRLPGKHHWRTDKRGECKQRARPDLGHSGINFCWLAVQVVTCWRS
jgi:hypothetical protein